MGESLRSYVCISTIRLGRYGITANAIAPAARTRMTEDTFAHMMKKPADGFDAMDASNISPLVVWLASAQARHVTGRVFEVKGGEICLYSEHRPGPSADKGARWEAEELGGVVDDLLARAPVPMPVYGQS